VPGLGRADKPAHRAARSASSATLFDPEHGTGSGLLATELERAASLTDHREGHRSKRGLFGITVDPTAR